MPNTLPVPPPDDLDPAETEVIRRKAHAMHRRGWVPRADLEDVRQDLALAVLAARGRLDAARGDLGTLAAAVVRRAGAKLARARRAAKRDPRRVNSLHAPRPDGIDLPDPDTLPGGDLRPELTDLRIDLDQFLARLPPTLRTVADLLRTKTVTAAARALGVPRSTLADRVRALRRRFAAAGLAEYFPGPSVNPPADG
ncbi:MAG: polymerase, sigma-24 subunit, subfamily [Gemmataceae bacterium]|nr:polymerase, sigma-24 subunit, subfamily [Gemmataceae bacterium]